MEESANGPVFRATKRRKVFRKRADSDASGDEPNVATTVQGSETATPDGTNSTVETQGEALSLSETTRVRRPKKHGIAFSSSGPSSSRPHNNEETAMVVSEDQPQDVQNGRFARQTGRTVVADDKHMSAYIDSKLAEMRSKAGAAALDANAQSASQTPNIQEANQSQQPTFDPTEDAETAPLSPQPPTTTHPTNHSIQPTTANANTKRRQPRRPRQPSPSTLARASLIDQIMRESNHTPHYTPPTTTSSSTATRNPTTSTTEEELDPDAAAAAAFKADFLAQAEARNLSRRKPKVPAATASGGAAAAGAAAVSSGPKLGGSRAARVRMRAAEEAKGKK